jgi:hypothetical protein
MDTDLRTNAITRGHAFVTALQIDCANQGLFAVRVIAALGLIRELAHIRRGFFSVLIDLSRFDAMLRRRTIL